MRYSNDLRKKVIDLVQNGKQQKEVAMLLNLRFTDGTRGIVRRAVRIIYQIMKLEERDFPIRV